LTDAQLDQVMTQAHQVPRALRAMYLQAVAERLRGKPFMMLTCGAPRLRLCVKSF
jgi:hypothetical protein